MDELEFRCRIYVDLEMIDNDVVDVVKQDDNKCKFWNE